MDRRGILIHPQDICMKWPDRLADAGINVLGFHPVGGQEAHLSLAAAIAGRDEPDMRRFVDALEARGIAAEYEMHALRYLMPAEMFEKAPEFFTMNDEGVRFAGPNMCASSRAGLAFVAEASRKLARTLPSQTHRYYFWLDDIATSGCRCPACRELSPSDQQTLILNAMLEGIRQADPLGELAYLAYVSTLERPQKVQPAEGLFLEYAPIHRDPHRPIADPTSEKNAAELKSLPEILKLFDPARAQVLEYWMDNSLYSGWKRPPKPFALDEAVMAEDVAYYRSLGFGSITSFGCFLGPDFEALYGEPPLAAYGRILAR